MNLSGEEALVLAKKYTDEHGGGGTTNYNDLINKPVINKTGTESSPIILNTLGYGEYIITGNFVYTNEDNTLKGGSFPTYISILQDGITLKKIAKYETFEDGIYYINTVSFNDDETCLIDKISIINSQEILAGIANLEAYLGITTDVAGLCVDYENKTFTRLAGAVGLSAGSDFDHWKMYGNRKRCNVADDGTILAYYGDAGFKEDGSNGQVMVYQPKFYYLVAPINYDIQETGVGYHLRKANYYVSEKPRTGFRLHPAFYDVNGNEVDYILMGAYEACLYDTSASEYITDDAQVMTVAEDKLSSIAGVKPVSGLTQNLTRPNVETLAQNRGSNWHGSTVKIASMNQLLCMIEMGTMDFQTAIGQGVVSYESGDRNEASNTGATSSLGNGTGQATQTTHISSGGTETIDTTSGKLSVSYRGLENPWGNIWEFEYGVNIWGNGNMAGGEPYVADDFNFAESKRTDNYEGAGFTVTNANGYISAMGYSTKCDWLFMASECAGNSSLPVGDYTYVTSNLNGYRIARLGGFWNNGANAGGFYWYLLNGVGTRSRSIGGRLVYVPTASV